MFELTNAFGDLALQVIVALETLLDFHHHPISMPGLMSSVIEDDASHETRQNVNVRLLPLTSICS